MTKKKKAVLISSVSVAGVLFACLIGLLVTGLTIGWGPFQFMYWPKEVERVKRDYPYENNQDGIVFYGASNFRLWKEMTNDLKEYKVSNNGFGGSTDELMMKYADELLFPYHPKVVFFQTASNDFANMSGSDEYKLEKALNNKKELIATVHQKLPDAKLVLMSGLLIPGRRQYTELTIKLNSEMDNYISTLDYMDFVNANDLTYDGVNYRNELFISDGIHFNHDAQLLWCNNYIRPEIESLISRYPELESVRK